MHRNALSVYWIALSWANQPFSAAHFLATASGQFLRPALRGLCFPGSALTPLGPSHKAAARFGSSSPRFWVPLENAASKSRHFHALFICNVE
jgi:hypothetical protein